MRKQSRNEEDQRTLVTGGKRICRFVGKEIAALKGKQGSIWLFPAVFLYWEALLRIIGKTGLFKGFLPTMLFIVGAGLFCGALTSIWKAGVRHVMRTVFLLLISIFYIVECLIRESFQMYMTIADIKSGTGGVVGNFSAELFRVVSSSLGVILLFLIPVVLYVWAMIKKKANTRLSVCQGGIVLCCGIAVSVLGVFSTVPLGVHHLYAQQYRFDQATQTFGLLTSLRLDIQYSIFGNAGKGDLVATWEKQPEEAPKEYGKNVSSIDFTELSESTADETIRSMHEYVSDLTPTSKNRYTGLFQGKNLILICAEAFSDAVIDEELTPTLYRLTHEGIYFSDYYQPAWGGSTSTGEYSFLTGLVPMDGVETMLETKNNRNEYTLGTQLMRQGYYSAAFHNGSYDYYSRNLTHENLGYASFLATGNGLEKISGAWPSDSVFFDTTMDTYIDQQPFSIYYMTLSGHAPYTSSDVKTKKYMDKVKEVLGDQYKETTLNYFCYQMELEEALTIMVERLEEAGIAEDTVICMTSDHYPYGLAQSVTFGNSEDYMEDLYQYKITKDWDRDHNTWLLWSGSLEGELKEYACEISEPTYSLDITPTLLNLFGIEYDSRLLVGRDVFSDAPALVLWNDGSWISDQGKYDSETGTFTPHPGVEADEEEIQRTKTIVANKIAFSNQVLKTDYYRILFETKE